MQTPGPDDPANKTCPVCPRNKPSLELSKAVVSDELELNYEMFGNSARVSHPSDKQTDTAQRYNGKDWCIS